MDFSSIIALTSLGLQAYELSVSINSNRTNEISRLNHNIERLSNNILFESSNDFLSEVGRTRQHRVEQLSLIRESIDPLQRILKDEIIVSSAIHTPNKLKNIVDTKPESIFVDITPIGNDLHKSSSAIPFVFGNNGNYKVGWQTKEVVAMLGDLNISNSQKQLSPYEAEQERERLTRNILSRISWPTLAKDLVSSYNLPWRYNSNSSTSSTKVLFEIEVLCNIPPDMEKLSEKIFIELLSRQYIQMDRHQDYAYRGAIDLDSNVFVGSAFFQKKKGLFSFFY